MNPKLTLADRKRLLHRATNASIAVAVTLALAKLVAFLLSQSVAVLASMVDSGLDCTASLVNALAVRYAMKPADAEHRFGHGKSEALAGLAQATLIAGSGVFILVRATQRLLHPEPLHAIAPGVVVMAISMTATLALVAYQRHVVRRTGSTAIKADALHYVTDLGANAGTIVALLLSPLGFPRLDPLLAIAVALTTLYGAGSIGWETFHVLMDHELPRAEQERIRGIALAHAKVHGLHDLRTRQAGPVALIQFHLELDGDIALSEANRIAHEVERALCAEFPGADVLIHQDAARDSRAPSSEGAGDAPSPLR